MVQVQKRHLTVFFAQDEEESVGEFAQLRDVVPPAEVGHLEWRKRDDWCASCIAYFQGLVRQKQYLNRKWDVARFGGYDYKGGSRLTMGFSRGENFLWSVVKGQDKWWVACLHWWKFRATLSNLGDPWLRTLNLISEFNEICNLQFVLLLGVLCQYWNFF